MKKIAILSALVLTAAAAVAQDFKVLVNRQRGYALVNYSDGTRFRTETPAQFRTFTNDLALSLPPGTNWTAFRYETNRLTVYVGTNATSRRASANFVQQLRPPIEKLKPNKKFSGLAEPIFPTSDRSLKP